MIQRYANHLEAQGDLVDSLRECFNLDGEKEKVAAVKAVVERHRERIRLANRSGASGTETVRYISQMVDTLIRVLWDQVEMSVPEEASLVALVAVGGYGRMELCPQSDIDLLILVPPSPSPEETRQAETVVRALWDFGFVLGSSVRSPAQCAEASKDDPETWTSFLSERFLAGDHELYRKFAKLVAEPLKPKRTSALVESKVRERARRKGQLGFLVQHLEPNLKEGIGCLRDVHSLMWIARVQHDCEDFGDLVREGLLWPQEAEDLRVAYDFLLQVRCCLHFLTRKKDDHLGFAIQPEVAEELGFAATGHQKPVEAFLKVFYHHTKNVNRITESVISRWVKPEGRPPKADLPRKHPHFKAEDGALDLKARVGNPFRENVGLMLEYFGTANRLDLGYANHAFLRMRQAVAALAASGKYDPKEHLGEFLALCQRPERVGRMLRTMSDVGLVALLIPDFAHIYCHSQHDIYHIYTTDEHTLTVVRQLAYLGGTADPELASLREARSRVNDMEVLILACVFHDIGKGVGPHHSVTGAKMAFAYMERMGFSPARCKEASDLVLYHLLMNEVIQRRDLDDPKTIRDFITKVGSPATLHKLYVLTYCDVSSVHPDAWSGWKASLLKRLYGAALEEMGSPFQATVSAEALRETLVESASKLVSEREVREHLGLLPRQYLTSTTPEEIVGHMRLLGGLGPERRFKVRVEERGTHWEVTVAAFDAEALLCAIAGALAHLELSILSARIFTRVDGLALDKFLVAAPPPERYDSRGLEERLERELDKNFRLGADELHALQLKFKGKNDLAGRKALPVEASITFSNSISDSFSTFDLTCKDRIGLLYQVAKVFSDSEVDVHGAILTTEADRAMDSFYVTDARGAKLRDEGKVAAVVEALKRELST